MSQSGKKTEQYAKQDIPEQTIDDVREQRKKDSTHTPRRSERIPLGNDCSAEGVEKRRDHLRKQGCCPESLCRNSLDIPPETFKGAIENFIGHVAIPVGVVGPLRINGRFAQGDFFIPLATTEGALVASYHRGAHVISRNGGVTALCTSESICRAPAFTFASILDAARFSDWAIAQVETFKAIAASTTRHGELIAIEPTWNSNTVFLTCEFKTGAASGQNMVTVATKKICEWVQANSPIQPDVWYVEGNFSGDKKATMLSLLSHRGRKVVAETTLRRKDVQRYLHSTPEAMAEYGRISTLGGIQSGSIGIQGHYANALAALFLCCGQDIACISEAAVGITTMQVTKEGDLYTSVSLPDLPVGTVGGGTFLPGAKDCLRMLGCEGSNHASKFAEICAALVLAGEISIIAALASGDFAKAHTTFRKKI